MDALGYCTGRVQRHVHPLFGQTRGSAGLEKEGGCEMTLSSLLLSFSLHVSCPVLCSRVTIEGCSHQSRGDVADGASQATSPRLASRFLVAQPQRISPGFHLICLNFGGLLPLLRPISWYDLFVSISPISLRAFVRVSCHQQDERDTCVNNDNNNPVFFLRFLYLSSQGNARRTCHACYCAPYVVPCHAMPCCVQLNYTAATKYGMGI